MPTYDTPTPIDVRCELVVGHLTVTASDRSDTVVEVRPSHDGRAADVRAAEQTRVELVEGRLTVKMAKNWRHLGLFGANGSVDVSIDVPTGSRLDAGSGMGDARVEGIAGECRLRTGMGNLRVDHAVAVELTTGFGDVTVDHADGKADVTTGSGQVRIGEVHGDAVVRNSNGPTTVGSTTGHLRVKAANGDVDVGRAEGSVVVKTACGDIRVAEVVQGEVVVETSVGRLEVGVRDGTAAWLDLRSQHGDVRSTLDAAEPPGPGDRTVQVRARTAVGDIVVVRASLDPSGRVAS